MSYGGPAEVSPSGRPVEGQPEGGVYEWYRRGLDLLGGGHADAAVTLLERAVAAEPGSRSLLEALGRAQHDAHRYDAAVDTFTRLIEVNPTDDYAQFGLGLAAGRAGRLELAAEHLALAVAMRPDLAHYGVALRGIRARRRRLGGAA